MSVQTDMSALAEAAAQRYGLLVEGWRGLYAAALDDPAFGSPDVTYATVDQAYQIARRFLADEAAHIDRAVDQIACKAHQATSRELGVDEPCDLAEAVCEHLSEAESYLHAEITVQVERDIAFLRQALRRTFLQVSLAARAHGLSRRAALIQYRIGNAAELQFFFHDRGNQKWASRKFIRAVWRHSLLGLYNELVLIALADHGETLAEVRHVNVDAHSHGMKIAMAASSKHPIYAEIRNEIFHPNSDAILGRAG